MKYLVLIALWISSTAILVLASVNYAYKKGVEDAWVHGSYVQMGDQFVYDKILDISGTDALRKTLWYDLNASISAHQYSMKTQSFLSGTLGPKKEILNRKESYVSYYKKIQEHIDYESKELVWLIENLE